MRYFRGTLPIFSHQSKDLVEIYLLMKGSVSFCLAVFEPHRAKVALDRSNSRYHSGFATVLLEPSRRRVTILGNPHIKRRAVNR